MSMHSAIKQKLCGVSRTYFSLRYTIYIINNVCFCSLMHYTILHERKKENFKTIGTWYTYMYICICRLHTYNIKTRYVPRIYRISKSWNIIIWIWNWIWMSLDRVTLRSISTQLYTISKSKAILKMVEFRIHRWLNWQIEIHRNIEIF